MAGLLAYAAAGAAAGLGKGLVEQAEMARREAMEALRIGAEERMQGRRIEHDAEQRALDRAQGTTLQESAQAHDRETLGAKLSFEAGQAGANRDLEREITNLRLTAEEAAQVRQIEAAQGTAAADRALERYRVEIAREDRREDRETDVRERERDRTARLAEGAAEREARSKEITAERAFTLWRDQQPDRAISTGEASIFKETYDTVYQNTGDFDQAVTAAERALTAARNVGRSRGGGLLGGAQGGAGGVDISTIPQRAKEALRGNPLLRDQFDAKYGPGAAAAVLGQ